MAAYYKTIKGVKYDAELLKVAEEGVAKFSLVNMELAQLLFHKVIDGDTYTEVEKRTIAFVREAYEWQLEADLWFRKEVRVWAAKKK